MIRARSAGKSCPHTGVNEAKAAIAILPPGPATDVLHLMADAVINREF